MAAVAIATLPLIDIGDAQYQEFIPTEAIPGTNVDSNDSEASTDTEQATPIPASVLADREKRFAQKTAFDAFLKEHNHQNTSAVDKDTNADSNNSSNPVSAKSRRIIDEVRNYQQELFERALEENVIAV